MKTHDFYYDLPERLIAQTPVEPRDASRMLVCNRNNHHRAHRHFFDLPEYLRPGDAVVINHTKVIPARLIGIKVDSGVACEVLLLKRLEQDLWEALVRPGRRLKTGSQVTFGTGELQAEILESTEFGGRVVHFRYNGVFEQILDALGQMPLPPYIHEKLEDKDRYQTIYAKNPGSAAAPTAGLHFNDELLEKIEAKGVVIARLTLHVGLGTFRPVKAEYISEHKMHSEYYELSEKEAEKINAAKRNGKKIISVGTTSTRTLETIGDSSGFVREQKGWTDIFIFPGYKYRVVDCLITNFHLPESTLIMLVSALAGKEHIMNAYKIAVEEKYRFFSFGDAMLIK